MLLSSLAHVANQTKCLFLNNGPCMVRPILIDMNPDELKYHPFIISFWKCTGGCKMLFLQKYVFQKKQKTNVKNICKLIVNANSIVLHVIQNKKGIIKHVNVNVNIVVRAKKNIV